MGVAADFFCIGYLFHALAHPQRWPRGGRAFRIRAAALRKNRASGHRWRLSLHPPPIDRPPPTNDKEADAILSAANQRLQQPEPFSLDRHLAETERNYIEAALQLAHGNVSQAARLLGINRTTLYNRMESFARGQ